MLPDDTSLPVHYLKASKNLIFDVRMLLECKARLVKDIHKNSQPEWSTLAGVVSREIIRIALTYAALNDLPVFGSDIKNDYLQDPSLEKQYIMCGPNFGM